MVIDDLDTLDIPGIPLIPFKNFNILLPYGEDIDNIEISTDNEISLEGRYLLEPGKIPITYGNNGIKYESPLDFSLDTIKVEQNNFEMNSSDDLKEPNFQNPQINNSIIKSQELFLDKKVYNSAGKYPEELYSKVFIQQFRGYRILVLRLFPVQYYPISGS